MAKFKKRTQQINTASQKQSNEHPVRYIRVHVTVQRTLINFPWSKNPDPTKRNTVFSQSFLIYSLFVQHFILPSCSSTLIFTIIDNDQSNLKNRLINRLSHYYAGLSWVWVSLPLRLIESGQKAKRPHSDRRLCFPSEQCNGCSNTRLKHDWLMCKTTTEEELETDCPISKK